jgi:3-phenylpropionate/cinnamic acid dioxygenase small subunit
MSADLQLHYDVSSWLVTEAELLDGQRFREWLGLLSEDIRYRMPVTVTTARHATRTTTMDHFDEDRYSLEKRVERLEGDHAWTEDPPSRTRRFVTNIRVTSLDGGDVRARSYLLLYRSRGDDRPADLVSAERVDHLRAAGDGGWLLARREITVDEAVLRTQNLAVFL